MKRMMSPASPPVQHNTTQHQCDQDTRYLGNISRPGDPSRTLLRKNTSDHSPAKMIRMTLTVVMVYSLCWLPFNTLMVILDFLEAGNYWPHTHHVWFVFHWLAMSHACYNPLILCWMNTKFRQGYLRALYRLLPCCRPRLSHHLLELRQSTSLQRAHTYSSAFGSTRGGSRNNR
ncbi:hypothetical protein Pmani_013952 [Petrolisthes manimaculis]|uniref:G-protein coupled receptors family 1 profile domain-containing protein n=1 Tax=Petrolisthes manimaculis TaxID=1843537 RepID=A0AAE1NGC3_9EUCA|nr:hypothetical protein Pmani_038362 [Petrolisthes manimaculis]KAK4314786.1 hypothetical protein Pmani_013952 [Petrolisthes manimaculis]